jgi:transcriptional regulator with XRE-family HTH domain
VSKPRFVSTEPELGRFAEAVHAAMDQKGMTTVDFSEALGVSYEHARKLLNSMAFPSTLLLDKICKILAMDKGETEQILIADRIRRKYGTLGKVLPQPQHRTYGFAKLERKLSHVTVDQLSILTQLIDMMIKANGA